MIEYKKGNIFQENVEAIVNTVNCVGIMGRGIALQAKQRFPDNFKAYKAACKNSQVHPGKMFVFATGHEVNPKFIINFPTKRHWKTKSRMQDIETGLHALVEEIKFRKIKSIAIPPLGSGLGGLDWSEVKIKIENSIQELQDVKIIIFEPCTNIVDNNKFQDLKSAFKMTRGRAALVSLIDRYLNGLMDPFISLLEIHKLMYFIQESGEPLRLNFKKSYYGPYAENLRHVLNAVEGHLISGFANSGDKPDAVIELIPSALKNAKEFLERDETIGTKIHIENVTDLVDGFETPFGLELLSTVHWLVKNERADSLSATIEKVYQWNDRKKQFTKDQIEIAYNVLKQKDWFN